MVRRQPRTKGVRFVAHFTPPPAVFDLQDLPLFLSVPEVARVLRIGTSSVHRLLRSGDLKAVRFGRSVRIPRSEVERLLTGGQ